MASAVGSKRSLITSLVLSIVIAFGSLGATLGLGWGPKLGLDLAGGLSVVYKPATPGTTLSQMQEVVTILNNRVNGLGVSGATVQLQGKNVVVSAPGVSDARAVLAAVGETAQLLFRPVLCSAATAKKVHAVAPGHLPLCQAKYLDSQANLAVQPNASNPNGFTVNQAILPDPQFSAIASTIPNSDNPKNEVILSALGSPARYVLGPAVLTGTAIGKAFASLDQAGAWVVNYTLTKAGSPLWDAVTKTYFHQELAIELDGVVQSAPLILPASTTWVSYGGQGQISGSFTEASAKKLAIAMEFGALPVRLIPLTTTTVSPTLGHSALIAGLGAGLVGLALVLLYVLLYYRALGLVILLGLGATAAFLWALISALAHTAVAPTFSLSGVTGLIVSIGITVDSYIVYFERLKDEARAGRSIRTSVDRGFKSAWRTVLAADFVSLLAAVLLYLIAVGDVRGFAFFLGLSTLMDIFFTWYFTRPLVILLGRRSSQSGSALSMAAGIAGGSAHE
jgi:preprotein translocase subunit SecD